MSTQRTERAHALAGLREFQGEAASLREALKGYERALERVCSQIEQGALLHEMMHEIGVGDLRADLVERLTRFEAARHHMRVACFRMSLTEGLSIGDIARLWGISRQLASRLVNEPLEWVRPLRGCRDDGIAHDAERETALRGERKSRVPRAERPSTTEPWSP